MKSLKTGLLLLGLTLSSHASSILWVSDNGPESTNTAVGGVVYPARASDMVPALPTFSDQDFVELLISAGHTVTRFNPTGNSLTANDITVLNSYDLVILGTALNSGPFNLQSRAPAWNRDITKPMIITKSTLIHKQRFGLLTGNTEFDSGADSSTPPLGKLAIPDPENPVFQGVAHAPVGLDEIETMTNYSGIRIATPPRNRGTDFQVSKYSINGVNQVLANGVNNVEGGGTVLATVDFNPMNPGVNIPSGASPTVDPTFVCTGYAIVEWPKGASVRHDSSQTSGPDTLGGYRMFFGCGTRDASGTATGAPNPLVGAMDLSPDGQRLFLNAVNRALGLPLEITNVYASFVDNELNVTWNTAPGESYSVYATSDLAGGSWSVIAGPLTATLPSITARLTGQTSTRRFYQARKN